MFNKKNIITLICLLVFAGKLYAQNDFCNIKNTSFKDDEKLTFRVFYNVSFVWINAGNAHFTTTSDEMNGHKCYHVTGDGKTAKSYVFFKVNDKYETYIDKETMLPVRFVRKVNEGGFKSTRTLPSIKKRGRPFLIKRFMPFLNAHRTCFRRYFSRAI
jgi:hypothetical protein